MSDYYDRNNGTNLPPGISDPGNECEFSQREKREFLAERGWKRDDRELREFWIRGEESLPLDDAFAEVVEREIYPKRESNVRRIAQAIVEADSLTEFTVNFFDNYIAIQRAEAKMRERS